MLYILASMWYGRSLDVSPSNRCAVVFHCGFYLHVHTADDDEPLVLGLFVTIMPVQTFSQFLTSRLIPSYGGLRGLCIFPI